MKIDSVKNFFSALIRPFSPEVEVSKLQRVALVCFSILFVVPIVIAGALALVGRVTKKNPDQLNKTEEKTSDKANEILKPSDNSSTRADQTPPSGQQLLPSANDSSNSSKPANPQTPASAVEVQTRSSGGAEEQTPEETLKQKVLAELQSQLPITAPLFALHSLNSPAFFDALSQVKMGSEEQERRILRVLEGIAYISQDHSAVLRCIDSFMRLTESTSGEIKKKAILGVLCLGNITSLRPGWTRREPIDQEIVSKMKQCVEAILIRPNADFRTFIREFTHISLSGVTPELRAWGLDKLMHIFPSIKNDYGLTLTIQGSLAEVASMNQHGDEALAALRCLFSLFKSIMASDLSVQDKKGAKDGFFLILKQSLYTCIEVTGSFSLSELLLEELRNLGPEYSNEAAPLIEIMSKHPAYKQV